MGIYAIEPDGVTYEEIGEQLGVSHTRVQQIEKRAIRKCRRWCAEHGYEPGDLLPDRPIGDAGAGD